MNIEDAITLISRGANPIKIAETVMDPKLEYPEGGSGPIPSRVNTLKTTPPSEYVPGAGETQERNDTEKDNAGVRRKNHDNTAFRIT